MGRDLRRHNISKSKALPLTTIEGSCNNDKSDAFNLNTKPCLITAGYDATTITVNRGAAMNRTFLTDIDLATRYSISRATVWRWASCGRLPRPIRLGEATTRWVLDDLIRHEQRLRQHDPELV